MPSFFSIANHENVLQQESAVAIRRPNCLIKIGMQIIYSITCGAFAAGAPSILSGTESPTPHLGQASKSRPPPLGRLSLHLHYGILIPFRFSMWVKLTQGGRLLRE
jgi:hypothetical protein